MSGKHFWLLLYYPQVVPYEWTPTSLSWVHYHVRPNRGSCLRNKSSLISETCLEKWICMKQLKLFQAICCMHWHERWCITTQYLLPVWPCSPGGSSAAVAIQTRNYTLDLIWRKLGVFIHPFKCIGDVSSARRGPVWKKMPSSRTVNTLHDFMLEIPTTATLNSSADGAKGDINRRQLPTKSD